MNSGSILWIPLLWILIASAAGIGVALASPHGLAAFTFSAFVLGAIGSLFHIGLEVFRRKHQKTIRKEGVDLGLGLMVGLISFPATTFLTERQLYFPHDLFQWSLFAFLVILGIGEAFTVGRISYKAGLRR